MLLRLPVSMATPASSLCGSSAKSPDFPAKMDPRNMKSALKRFSYLAMFSKDLPTLAYLLYAAAIICIASPESTLWRRTLPSGWWSRSSSPCRAARADTNIDGWSPDAACTCTDGQPLDEGLGILTSLSGQRASRGQASERAWQPLGMEAATRESLLADGFDVGNDLRTATTSPKDSNFEVQRPSSLSKMASFRVVHCSMQFSRSWWWMLNMASICCAMSSASCSWCPEALSRAVMPDPNR
mmetsp:Transcript_23527/g.67382  ORF Transcript_23527/g.67382 Transcript_23527/m.67382 type:complete len:241 (-) Transcript_23527:33-755(-)